MMPSLKLFAKRRPPARRSPKRGSVGKRSGLLGRMVAAADRLAFNWPIRRDLYRHLSAQIFHGVPIEQALELFRQRLQRRKKVSSSKIVADINRRMKDGSTLALALGRWIPQDEVGMIASGEIAGNLPRALDLVIEAKSRMQRVNTALKTAMAAPLQYLALVYLMLYVIGSSVTPALQQALPRDRARGAAAFLYAAGDYANSLWALLPLALAAALIGLVIRSLPRWTGARRVSAERFLPYSFYRDVQGYGWLMSFSALLRAGMADVEILKRQVKQSSPWMKERLHAIWWRMDNGMSLPAALLSKGKHGMPGFGFPSPNIIDDISSMAGFADFSERISVVAVQWADELEASTLAMARTFGRIMEFVMFAIMGFLMVAVNSLSQQMGSIPTM